MAIYWAGQEAEVVGYRVDEDGGILLAVRKGALVKLAHIGSLWLTADNGLAEIEAALVVMVGESPWHRLTQFRSVAFNQDATAEWKDVPKTTHTKER